LRLFVENSKYRAKQEFVDEIRGIKCYCDFIFFKKANRVKITNQERKSL
jgi:hypothetical protein